MTMTRPTTQTPTHTRRGKVLITFTDGDYYNDGKTSAIRLNVTISTIINRIINHRHDVDVRHLNQILDGSRIMTMDIHRGSRRINLDDTIEQLIGVPFVQTDEVKDFKIYVWETANYDCTRCGICCMFHFTEKNDAYNTPISTDTWIGKGVHRCVNLQFDAVTGNYACAKVDERSVVCERYLCEFMKKGDLAHVEDSDPAMFGTTAERPGCYQSDVRVNDDRPCYEPARSESSLCSSGRPRRTCSNCRVLPHRVEWFIAYARRHELTKDDVEYATSLRASLNTSRINKDFSIYLIKIVDDIITQSSSITKTI